MKGSTRIPRLAARPTSSSLAVKSYLPCCGSIWSQPKETRTDPTVPCMRSRSPGRNGPWGTTPKNSRGSRASAVAGWARAMQSRSANNVAPRSMLLAVPTPCPRPPLLPFRVSRTTAKTKQKIAGMAGAGPDARIVRAGENDDPTIGLNAQRHIASLFRFLIRKSEEHTARTTGKRAIDPAARQQPKNSDAKYVITLGKAMLGDPGHDYPARSLSRRGCAETQREVANVDRATPTDPEVPVPFAAVGGDGCVGPGRRKGPGPPSGSWQNRTQGGVAILNSRYLDRTDDAAVPGKADQPSLRKSTAGNISRHRSDYFLAHDGKRPGDIRFRGIEGRDPWEAAESRIRRAARSQAKYDRLQVGWPRERGAHSRGENDFVARTDDEIRQRQLSGACQRNFPVGAKSRVEGSAWGEAENLYLAVVHSCRDHHPALAIDGNISRPCHHCDAGRKSGIQLAVGSIPRHPKFPGLVARTGSGAISLDVVEEKDFVARTERHPFENRITGYPRRRNRGHVDSPVMSEGRVQARGSCCSSSTATERQPPDRRRQQPRGDPSSAMDPPLLHCPHNPGTYRSCASGYLDRYGRYHHTVESRFSISSIGLV